MTTFPTVRALAKDAGVDRVLVNGVDITWFRATGTGAHQPIVVPGYTLMEPFAYGSSQPLTIPRTNSLFEAYGSGDLAWLQKGARVQYQRVLPDDSIVTDYRGVITAVQSSGKEWVAIIGGEVSARAALIDVQPPLKRNLRDIGAQMKTYSQGIGLHFTAPVTGIEMPPIGGMTLMAVFQQYGAWSRTSTVNQRALMPTVWGGTEWAWEPIDKTTMDCTIPADGQRIALNLTDDVTEQPNTVYGSGVTPSGKRWRNVRRPGIRQGPPDDYPIAGGAPFGLGTTNADTLDGFGISSMKIKLSRDSLLPDRFNTGDTFDSHCVAAVNRLKHEAGLTEDGMMTTAAWAAMWNTDVVGFSTEGSRIFPLAQASRVKGFLYSSTGDVIGRNPGFVSGSIRVDRTIPYGICEKTTAADNARSIVAESSGHQWAGTITLNSISVWSGEHDNSDMATLTTDDILVARDIRPGMNAWLPYFDGGTLVHISGVDVAGDTVTLTVSTNGLDIFDLSSALARNQESKRNVYREWITSNRPTGAPGNFVQRDEDFGVLGQNVTLRGGHWNVVEIPMGQSGTVSRTHIITTNDATEFCFAVFSKKMHDAAMDALIGNPFNLDGDGLTVWEQSSMTHYFDQRLLLTIQGQGAQPCGYYWQPGYDADGNRTASPLTGSVLDDSTWSYVTDPNGEPVVYLCVYPRDDCTLKAGELFAALEDDVT